MVQLSDVIDFELASGLAEGSPVVLWKPDRSVFPLRPGFQEAARVPWDSSVSIRKFPLVRGYARRPISTLVRTGPALAKRLARHSPKPEEATLVCTTPYFASVAERWPGPVVYWLTDLMARYDGVDPALLLELDQRLCQVATLVCPASARIARYLCEEAGCRDSKIQLLPNAARAKSVVELPLMQPEPLTTEATPWTGPVAGVLGNLADNMDWVFLREVLERTPWLSWAFVGPTGPMTGPAEQIAARTAVMQQPQAHFLGPRRYRELYRYARAFSVAVLPYRHREPTYSGSSTRLYEHLAACHPILATPCVAELHEKEPLLRLVGTPGEAVTALEALRETDFDDGQRLARWEASLTSTWKDRADTMRSALAARLSLATH